MTPDPRDWIDDGIVLAFGFVMAILGYTFGRVA